jgi:predicted RNA-binding protein with PUA-like domain
MTIRPTPDYASGMWAHIFTPRQPGEVRHWLVKSEPDVFSWDQLVAAPDRTTFWNSVRNYSARNFMLDGMQLGDRVFYYHSNADPQAIVGIAEVAKLAYPDHTQFEKDNEYYDADSMPEAPTWWMVDVRAVEPLARPVTLAEIKATPALANMSLLKVGRLSVVPVTPAEWKLIVTMAAQPAPIATKPVVKPKAKAATKPKPAAKPKAAKKTKASPKAAPKTKRTPAKKK